MSLDVAPDEGTEGQHRQAARTRVVKCVGHELAAEALAFEAVVDFGVDEGEAGWALTVLGEAGQLATNRTS